MGKSKTDKLPIEQLREFRHGLSVKDRYHLLEHAIKDRESSLTLLGFDNYSEYLKSSLWNSIRRKVYVRANGSCEACGDRKPENVHHWSYSVATLQGKKLKNLEAVCKPCHDQFHEQPRRKGRSERQMTPMRVANQAWRALVSSGGLVVQPRDMTPRLVKKNARPDGIYDRESA